jgi:biotin--protein ligase
MLMVLRFAAVNLSKQGNGPDYTKVVEALEQDDKLRVDFLKACLRKLSLQVNETEQSVPSLSRLHISSIRPTELADLLADLQDIIIREDGQETIRGANDTFVLERRGRFSVGQLTEAISSVLPSSITGGSADDEPSDGILDYNKVIKRVIAHEDGFPSAKETPYFNHAAYYANWTEYVRDTNGTEGRFGKHLIYGEVVTSTSTMLEKYACQ